MRFSLTVGSGSSATTIGLWAITGAIAGAATSVSRYAPPSNSTIAITTITPLSDFLLGFDPRIVSIITIP